MDTKHCSEINEKNPLLEESQESSEQETKPRTERRYGVLLTIVFLQFFSRASDTIVFPFFPEAATVKGLSMTEVGVTMAAYDMARFISSPILGSLLLKWPPKSMAAVGTLVTALACGCFGATKLVNNKDWFLVLCLLIRVIVGIGSTMITIASTSILLKTTGFSSATIIGLIEIMAGCSFGLGPAIGAALFELVGYAAVFWIFAALLLAALPAFLFLVPSIDEEKNEGKKNFFDLLAIPGCFLIFVVCLLTRINNSSYYVGLPQFYIDKFNKTVSLVGAIYGVGAIVYIIVCGFTARIINKSNKVNFPTLIFGWLLMALSWFLVGPSPILDFWFDGQKYFWLTTMMMLSSNIAAALVNIPPMPAALDLASVNGHSGVSLHTYGMVTGLINSGWGLGATVGPVIGGAIMDALDFEWTMTCLAFADVGMAFSLLAYLLCMRVTNQPIAPADQSTDEIQTDQTKTKKQQVADACHDRMNSCLENSADLTKVCHQQPECSDSD